MIFSEALQKIKNTLKNNNISNFENEARWLLLGILKQPTNEIIKNLNYNFKNEEIEVMERMVAERIYGKPLAYILGEQEFFGLKFLIDHNVLIPRTETECLVQKCIDILNTKNNPVVCEYGVGSGCVSISLIKNVQNLIVDGYEVSIGAINVCKNNCNLHNITNLNIIHKDVIQSVAQKDKYDLIVSNPPYVGYKDLNLDENVKKFEPHLALFSGDTGFEYYQKWLPKMFIELKIGGHFALEIGINMGKKIIQMATNFGFKNIEIHNDLSQTGRVIVGEKSG